MKDLKSTSAVSRRSSCAMRRWPRGVPPSSAPRARGPRHIAPSDRVNIATVGGGGWGASNLTALSSQNLVAMCDVDWAFVDSRFRTSTSRSKAPTNARPKPPMPQQKDRRPAADQGLAGAAGADPEDEALHRLPRDAREAENIDAVVIATPDHTHALIALAAMDLGKHVYVQKPLAWSVEECRRLVQKAAATKLQTQMGNQSHSSDDARLVNEYIQSGAIGTVTEVHVWTNRPLGYWPQGIPRPRRCRRMPEICRGT